MEQKPSPSSSHSLRALRISTLVLVVLVSGALCQAGSLNVTGGARYVGDFGLEVVVDTSSPTYVEDDSPVAEARYRLRFYVRLNPLTVGAAEEFDLFTAFNESDLSVLRLTVFNDGSDRRLRLTARLDDGSETATATGVVLADGWRAFEIDWQAASAEGANDGVLDLWVDGAAETGLAILDNDSLRIDHVRWGAVDGLDAGTSGSFYLDEFDSRRGGPIGLHPVFADVPAGHIFQNFILGLYNAGVTAGCGNGLFCIDGTATRGQMAVFLLKAHDGAEYSPPPCTIPSFGDVPCSFLFAPWIEEIFARGITAGCGGGNFCPDAPATRGQMAVFLLRTIEGSGYTPPPCTTPSFADVPCSHLFADWIEEIYARGITAGCGGGNFCPEAAITRGQMAVFLVKAFSLPLPTF